MLLRIVRKYRSEDVAVLRRAIRRRHGRFEKVKKMMHIKGCSNPELGEAFLFYLAMQEGAPIEEEVVIEDRKVFNALTAKRFELLEFINAHPPMSIKEIATRTGRDYKNVYDDVSSLSRYLVVNTVKNGKEIVPIGVVEGMGVEL